jgi:hypothetical protein
MQSARREQCTCGERPAVRARVNAGHDVLVLPYALQQPPLICAVAPDGVVPVPAAGDYLPDAVACKISGGGEARGIT